MTTLRTRLLVPLLLALLGVFAASCGGSEDSATETAWMESMITNAGIVRCTKSSVDATSCTAATCTPS